MTSEVDVKMEVGGSGDEAQMERALGAQDPVQAKLFESLYRLKNEHQSKAVSMALTIHAMYKNSLPVLVRLFEFYKERGLVDMASDLLENDLLRPNTAFSLHESDLFDAHLDKFSAQVILAASTTNGTASKTAELAERSEPGDRFYLDLYAKLSPVRQEKLVAYVLDKYRSNFGFLKSTPPVQAGGEGAAVGRQESTSSLTLSEFHQRLGRHRDSLFYIKHLVLAKSKYINDYGVYLIDGLLNIEKQLFASPQLQDPAVASVERRSLNVLRRICVVDLVPEFIYLIDKLDNRHCYRWIEKSLEFYCKYALNAVSVVSERSEDGRSVSSASCRYGKLRLLHDCELKLANQDGVVLSEAEMETVKSQLAEFSEYGYEAAEAETPFTSVFRILDEVGKKLDWLTITPAAIAAALPALQPQQTPSAASIQTQTELKLSYLFRLKSRSNEKQANISNSLLSKQISFYGIALFFSKLVEFQSIARAALGDRLVMARSFKMTVPNSYSNFLGEPVTVVSGRPTSAGVGGVVETVIGGLVYCIKLWHRFNQHKEFMTIVNKCLSNSKLDNLGIYKSFISDYYTTFTQSLSPGQAAASAASGVTWESLSGLELRPKVAAMAHLFINEKNSFQNFFAELTGLFEKLGEEEQVECSDAFYANLVVSESSFEAFELNYKNACIYFSKLLVEKFTKLVEQKPQNAFIVLNENDAYMGHLIVILQLNLNKCNFSDLYELIFHLIKQKGAFEYTDFFDYIYDEQVLQDFSLLASSDYKNFKKPGARFELRLSEAGDDDLNARILAQLNNEKVADKYKCLREFFVRRAAVLGELFEKTLKC